MRQELMEYWKVGRDYAGVQVLRLDREKLIDEMGQKKMEALIVFLSAHYAFNDTVERPSNEEKDRLVSIMIEARKSLGEVDPYAFVDSLLALERDVC